MTDDEKDEFIAYCADNRICFTDLDNAKNWSKILKEWQTKKTGMNT